MNRNRWEEKKQKEEKEKKLKQLRDDLEEEMLRQIEQSAASTTKPAVTAEEVDTSASLDGETTKRVIEALLFASSKPLTVAEIRKVLKGKKPGEIEEAIAELRAGYERDRRSFRLQPIAGGWELSTDRSFAPWIVKLEQQKKARSATQSALEALAIIAYKQPISRVEIEDLRGVDSSAVLSTLLERGLVKIVGKKEIAGRPFLYGTTEKFLEHFGLSGLDRLPNLDEIRSLVENSVKKETLLKEEGAAVAVGGDILASSSNEEPPASVIPAQAGIQTVDPRFRGGDIGSSASGLAMTNFAPMEDEGHEEENI